MELKKFALAVGITSTILTTATEAVGISPYRFYKKLVAREQIGVVREYYTEELSYDLLANRGDDIIIEKTIGKVINSKKDGRIYGTEGKYNYISYRKVKGAKKGDTILTICIYAPNSKGEDDIVERFDYIIDRKAKK